ADGIVVDQERLIIVNDRLSLLYDLQKKHRVSTIKELFDIKLDLENKLQATDSQEEQIELLKSKIKQLHQEISKQASQMTMNRAKATKVVEKEVQHVLARVGMPHAQLKIDLNTLPDFKLTGQDEVSFLFSSNKGQALQLIHKVASGGELSRI